MQGIGCGHFFLAYLNHTKITWKCIQTVLDALADQGDRVALKKSDLYALWKSCDELRGGMDVSHYKDCILTLLFVKFVSDRAKSDPHSLIDAPVDVGCLGGSQR